jgi:hypothetical protein
MPETAARCSARLLPTERMLVSACCSPRTTYARRFLDHFQRSRRNFFFANFRPGGSHGGGGASCQAVTATGQRERMSGTVRNEKETAQHRGDEKKNF